MLTYSWLAASPSPLGSHPHSALCYSGFKEITKNWASCCLNHHSLSYHMTAAGQAHEKAPELPSEGLTGCFLREENAWWLRRQRAYWAIQIRFGAETSASHIQRDSHSTQMTLEICMVSFSHSVDERDSRDCPCLLNHPILTRRASILLGYLSRSGWHSCQSLKELRHVNAFPANSLRHKSVDINWTLAFEGFRFSFR